MSCSLFSCFTKKASDPNIIDLKKHDKSIENHMKLAKKLDDKTTRILLLGPGGSGKTTILKQIKKNHPEFDEEELEYRRRMSPIIQNAVLDYMRILCEEYETHQENTCINPQFDDLRKELLELTTPCTLTPDIGYKIKSLWSDEGIKQTVNKRQYFDLQDNAQYFFNKIEEISSPHYVPSFDDYLRFRQRTAGFSQTNIIQNCGEWGRHQFQFTDVGGQRSERKKWMGFISEDIDAVLYVVAISDYDLTCFEDGTTNCLIEAINLFRTVMIKGRFLSNKSVLIFFNKYDLFKEKIKKVPITVAFDDFDVNEKNPNDEDDVTKFIARKFVRVLEEQLIKLTSPLHIVRTTALDTKNIQRILTDITTDLLQQNLKDFNAI